MPDEKVRENRARRAIARRGLALQKSRRRDPKAYDYGGYMIIDPYRNAAVAGAHPMAFSMSLDDVEKWLETE